VSPRVSDLLGRSDRNESVEMAARYADVPIENAGSARESVPPVLQPGEDGTKLTRDNANSPQISKPLCHAESRGWTSFHDRRGCADMARSLRIHPRKLVSYRLIAGSEDVI
jgi:hypothetical protein